MEETCVFGCVVVTVTKEGTLYLKYEKGWCWSKRTDLPMIGEDVPGNGDEIRSVLDICYKVRDAQVQTANCVPTRPKEYKSESVETSYRRMLTIVKVFIAD